MKKIIPSCKLDLFKEKLTQLNKRLTRYGKQPLEFQEIDRSERLVTFRSHEKGDSYKNDILQSYFIEFVELEIIGLEFFKKDDKNYRYIGSINYDKGIKTVYCIDEAYVEYFNRDYKICDHCLTNRYRKTYNLFETDGKVIQIGATCSHDYFGIDVEKFLNVYLQTFSIFSLPEDEEGDGYYESWTRKAGAVFAAVRKATNNFHKWVSTDKATSEEESTSATIRRELFDNYSFLCKEDKIPEGILERIREYWEKQETTSFVINMREALKKDYAACKNVGSYGFAIFRAMKAFREEEAAKNSKPAVECPYKDGERPSLSLEVTSIRVIQIQGYGYPYSYEDLCIVNFLSDDGVRYVTKSSAQDAFKLIQGDKVVIKGTISGIDEFKGVKSWVLKRIKIEKNQQEVHEEYTGQVEEALNDFCEKFQ